MAKLDAIHVLPIQGGFTAPQFAKDLYRFAFIEQPYESITLRSPGAAKIKSNLPVLANPHAIKSVRLNAYLDDFYYRIHITPQRLDLGNVVSTQTTDVYVWNAHLTPKTLSKITGTDAGLTVSGQDSLPTLYMPLKERVYQLSVTPDGQPVLDTKVTFDFSDEFPFVHVTANRIIGWTFSPDWSGNIQERFIWATDILTSETMVEQRRALRLSPRREFDAQMIVHGQERQFLEMALFGWGARIWALPLWHEVQQLDQALDTEVLFIPCQTEDLDFNAQGLAILRGLTAFSYETVEILTVETNGLTLKRPTQQAWPAGTQLYPARSAQLKEAPQAARKSDNLQTLAVRFEVSEQNNYSAKMPSAQYRNYPVLEQEPNQSEDLTLSYARLLATLDNGSAIALNEDIGARALPVQGYKKLLHGRKQHAQFKALLYALNGRQKALWIPTFNDDLTLVDTVTSASTVLDIAYIGYSRFGQQRTGRRDIRIELHTGEVFYRRIVASAEQSTTVERLALDSPLGQQIEPHQVRRISWLMLCRSDSDTAEIEHLTDSEGVAQTSLIFRGVRDDEFQPN
ncbi:hypothetical protein VQ643_04370 [Pseudomonas sp. F1_0610]|uniref:hypothetical protein n=1 Tax=Pseudomonas sp. F1_0610 TaxID=3114284 RepID=UPI0039C3036A